MNLSIADAIATGTISGILSGLIVAGTIKVISSAMTDTFSFSHVGNEKSVLSYRGSRPIVIGGSFLLGEGPVLTTADGRRAGQSGIVVRPRSLTVFDTGRVQPGEPFDFTYRKVPWLRFNKLERTGELYRWECDVMEFYNDSKPKKGWKLASAVLMPSI